MEMRDDILMEVNKINKAIKTKKRIKRMKKKQEEPEASQPEMKADDRKFKRHLDSYLLTDDSNRAFGIDIGEHNGAFINCFLSKYAS